VQVPLQQADELLQAPLSAVQLEAPLQVPLAVSQRRLQQSVFTAHELPAPLQVETDEEQVLATGSHDCEQHSAFEVHAEPVTVHLTPTPPPPPVPVCDPPVPAVLPPFPPPPVEEPALEPHPIPTANRATIPSRARQVDVPIGIATPAEQPVCRAADHVRWPVPACACTAKDSRWSIPFSPVCRLSIEASFRGADALSDIRAGA
jgi:hypothetical protein